jgi:heptaprenyl diphosphate synthase
MSSAAASLVIGERRRDDLMESIAGDLLGDQLERYAVMLERALEPQRRHLTPTEHQIYRRGKRLRPIMLLLAARVHLDGAPVPEKVIMASASLEMLHVATLIHDDIIDNALTRRGLESVNARRGTNAAILIGDLQFVQAIRTFADAIESESEMGLVKLVLDTAFDICCGELDELEARPDVDTATQRRRYFEVVERKTAIMFGLACETGAALVGGRTSETRRMGFYGRRVGRAFQIMDDIFDCLLSSEQSGKGCGTDLAQRRLSLPIIYAMEELGPTHLLSRLMRGAIEPAAETVREALAAMQRSTALDRAYADARDEAVDALEYLQPAPANAYSDALRRIALHTVERSS